MGSFIATLFTGMLESYINWQSWKSIGHRLLIMRESEAMCDVTFLVGPNKTPIKAHKLALSSASAVFFNMFEGPMAEKSDISVPDIEPDHFRIMLEFIYSDEHKVTTDNVSGLVYAAEKYMLENLKEACISHLNSEINGENACTVFQIAENFSYDELKEESLTFILENAVRCLSSDSFLQLSKKALKQIIESDKLDCGEEKIYRYAILWAKEQCNSKGLPISSKNIRHVLGEILYEIRFPLISPLYFNDAIKNSNILKDSEIVEVYGSFFGKGSDIFRTHCRIGFAITFMRCEEDLKGSWCHEGARDRIDFKSSLDCFLIGVYIFGSKTFSGRYEPIVTVFRGLVKLHQTTTIINCCKGNYMYKIILLSPVNISKDTVHTIELKMTGNDVFRGKGYKDKIQHRGWSVDILESSMASPNLTGKNAGQIPGLILSHYKVS